MSRDLEKLSSEEKLERLVLFMLLFLCTTEEIFAERSDFLR